MTQFSEKDFDQMQAAVLNTARGRWFLAEHAKRHHVADTATLLEAIAKLERGIVRQAGASIPAPVLSELDGIRKSLASAKQEFTAVIPDIIDEVASRRAIEALVSLDRAETRLDGIIGKHAPHVAEGADAEEPRAAEATAPEPAPPRQRVLIVRNAPENVSPPSRKEEAPPVKEERPEARGRIQVVRGKSSDETRIPLVEDAPDSSVG